MSVLLPQYRRTSTGPSYLGSDLGCQWVRGKRERVPSEEKREVEPFNPASVVHVCLHMRAREAGCTQTRQSGEKKRPAQIIHGNPLQPAILHLPSGEGLGLRKRPFAEIRALKTPCCTPTQNPVQSQ